MGNLLIIGHCPSNVELVSPKILEHYTVNYLVPDANMVDNITKHHPCIILFDMSLNNVYNNKQFYQNIIKYIASHERTRLIPIMLLCFGHFDDQYILPGISAGALDYIDNTNVTEIMLVKLENHMQRYIDILLLQESIYVDHLTGLYNRRYYEFIITNEWSRTQRDHSSLTILLLDVDFFKKYNDLYGHLLGDECLKQIAKSLQCSLYRPYDAAIRMGGEEFSIILPNTNQHDAGIIAERIKQNIIDLHIPHEFNRKHGQIVTVSIGCATYTNNVNSIKNYIGLYKQADIALYKAKESGRNKICVSNFN